MKAEVIECKRLDYSLNKHMDSDFVCTHTHTHTHTHMYQALTLSSYIEAV